MEQLDINYYKNELEQAIRNLKAARDEIQFLQQENDKLVEELKQTKKSGRIVIESQDKIKNIEIYYE